MPILTGAQRTEWTGATGEPRLTQVGGPEAPAQQQQQPEMPWVGFALVGAAILGAAFWWEKTQRPKAEAKLGRARRAARRDEDADEDSADEPQDDVDWTDEPVGKSKRRRRAARLSDVGGPISDTFIQPARLAAQGDCEAAVRLLDKQSRASEGAYGPRKTPIVRRALRRSAVAVTAKCPKELEELLGHGEAEAAEIEADTGMQLPSSGRREVGQRRGVVVPRTRGEAGRFKRKTAEGSELEYRKKGDDAWRIVDLKTGEQREKRIPTGRKAGRPKKLSGRVT